MSRSERDLVTALRAELAAIDPARAVRPSGRGGRPRVRGRGARRPAARLAVRLAARRRRDDPAIGGFDWASAAEHCRLGVAARAVPGPRVAQPAPAAGRTSSSSCRPSEAPILAARLRRPRAAGLVAAASRPRGRDLEERRVGRHVPATDRGRRGAARTRGAPGVSGPARRAQPGPQRGVGQPPARRECRRPAARRDRRPRRRRPARRTAGLRAGRGGRPPRDPRSRPCPSWPNGWACIGRRSSVRSSASRRWPCMTTAGSGVDAGAAARSGMIRRDA